MKKLKSKKHKVSGVQLKEIRPSAISKEYSLKSLHSLNELNDTSVAVSFNGLPANARDTPTVLSVMFQSSHNQLHTILDRCEDLKAQQRP